MRVIHTHTHTYIHTFIRGTQVYAAFAASAHQLRQLRGLAAMAGRGAFLVMTFERGRRSREKRNGLRRLVVGKLSSKGPV